MGEYVRAELEICGVAPRHKAERMYELIERYLSDAPIENIRKAYEEETDFDKFHSLLGQVEANYGLLPDELTDIMTECNVAFVLWHDSGAEFAASREGFDPLNPNRYPSYDVFDIPFKPYDGAHDLIQILEKYPQLEPFVKLQKIVS